jgi:hypothetical protein
MSRLKVRVFVFRVSMVRMVTLQVFVVQVLVGQVFAACLDGMAVALLSREGSKEVSMRLGRGSWAVERVWSSVGEEERVRWGESVSWWTLREVIDRGWNVCEVF